ncbi:MAG: CheR family methyltransferase [Pseudonocardia sp.]
MTLSAYREYVQKTPNEWSRLDALTDVTISRFYRDRSVFDFLLSEVFPALVKRADDAGSRSVRVWSTGCANGEEPYTLGIMWEMEVAATASGKRLQILATDIKPAVLDRANDARYPPSSVRDLPGNWREAAFSRDGDEMVLRPRFRRNVTFAQHDIRLGPSAEMEAFDLVMCRYQAFTYFDTVGQRNTLAALSRVTRPGAVLVLGRRESLPSGEVRFRPLAQHLGVFQRNL